MGHEAKRDDPVQILLLLLLMLLFLIPGIVYLVYVIRGSKMCPRCKTRKMIPVDTPLGSKLVAEASQSQRQAGPRFRSKTEYEAWKASQGGGTDDK